MKALVLNRIVLVLSFAGMYVSGVLSLATVLNASIPCGASHGCDEVANHPSAQLLGFPNAYLGFAMYLLIAALVVWRILGSGNPRKSLIAGYTITALGTLFSLLLTYISIAEIHATCIWCLTSTGIMVVLLILHALLMQETAEPAPAGRIDAILLPVLILATLGLLAARGVELRRIAHTKPLIPTLNVEPSLILPADAHSFGSPDAKVTIVEFGDLLCPACKAEYPLMQDYVRKSGGRVKFAFRHHPMVQMTEHRNALPAALIAEVAFDKGQFWDFLTAIYQKDEKDLQDINAVIEVARGIGMDTQTTVKRISDQTDPAFKRGMRDLADGEKLGINSTPTIFIMAEGVKPRITTSADLFDDLKLPQYARLING